MSTVVLAWLLCAMIGRADVPAAPGDALQIAWERDLDVAVRKCAEEHRPLFIAVNMDGESACERIVREQYKDPAFVALTRRAVCVVASAFRHSARDVDDQGRRIPCPRLGRVTCGEHMALEPILFERYLGGDRIAPRHALITPEGKKRFDLTLLFDLAEVDRTFARALEPWPDPRSAGAEHAEETETAFESWRRIASRTTQRAVAEKLVETARDFGFVDRGVAALEVMVRDVQGVPPETSLNEAQCYALAVLDPAGARTRTMLLSARVLDRDPLWPDAGSAAVAACLGSDAAALVEAKTQTVAFDADHLLRLAKQVRLTGQIDPKVSDPKLSDPEEGEAELMVALNRGLDDLSSGDVTASERVGRASLELAKRKLDIGGEGGHLYLADAERFLDRAIEARPGDPSLYVARAHAAYMHGRFEDQERYAAEASARLAALPQIDVLDVSDLVGGPFTEDVWHEAARWTGDAAARLLVRRAGGDAVTESLSIARGGRALLVAAASARADDTDWLSAASFLGAVGLKRAEVAWLDEGILRFGASNALRQAMNGALWRAGRPALAARHAERILALTSPGPLVGTSLWYLGYARLLAGDQLRREERSQDAIDAYQLSAVAFESCAAERPDFAASCAWYRAFVRQSIGFAYLLTDRQADAADALVAAIESDRTIVASRDGLDRETLDLVDGSLEWRARGPSPVNVRTLLRRLEAADPDNAFWALALADTSLREALRAEGRGDMAAFDRYMVDSVHSSRRARELRDDDGTRRQFVQSSTVFAEGLLARDQIPRARELLYFAAQVMDMELPGRSAGSAEVTALARRLRDDLGERRPLDRPGR